MAKESRSEERRNGKKEQLRAMSDSFKEIWRRIPASPTCFVRITTFNHLPLRIFSIPIYDLCRFRTVKRVPETDNSSLVYDSFLNSIHALRNVCIDSVIIFVNA